MELPDNLTSIGTYAFYGCTGISKIVIPDAVTSVGTYAFCGCTGLTRLVWFGGEASSIGNYAFRSCTGLTEIYFNSVESVPTISSSAFYGVTSTAYYPASSTAWTGAVQTNYGGTLTWVPYNFEITVQPADQYETAGDMVTYSIEVEGNDLQYQWQMSSDGGENWTDIGENAADLSFTAQANLNGSRYRCIIDDASAQQRVSESAGLDVFAIISHPCDANETTGDPADFSVEAIGLGLSYQWQVSADNGAAWENIGTDTANLSFTADAAMHKNQYRCVITDQRGEVLTSNTASLTVFAIVGQPGEQDVLSGETAAFEVEAIGSGLTYQWQVSADDGTNWDNMDERASALSLIADHNLDGNLYRCVITDGRGRQLISEAIELTVFAVVSHPEPQNQTAGDMAGFSVSLTGKGLSYQWQVSSDNGENWEAVGTNAAVLSIMTGASLNGNLYRCVVTDHLGRKLTSDAAKLTVFDITGDPEDQDVTGGTEVTFSVSAVGESLSYRWQVSTNNGVTWKSAGSLVSNLTVTAQAAMNGNQYRCVVTDVRGEELISGAAVLNVFAITAEPNDVNVTVGDYASFRVGAVGQNLIYQWQISSDNGKNWNSIDANAAELNFETDASMNGSQYRCVITDHLGRILTTNTASLTVFAITGQPENQDVINGEEAVFDITATGMDLSYQWQISTDGGETWEDADCTTSDFTVTAQASMNGSQYRCVVTDVRGEELISGAAVLNVFAITGEPNDVNVTVGDYASFRVGAVGQNLIYQWQISSDNGKNWNSIDANAAELNFETDASMNGSQYRCVITDHLGRILTTNTASLTVFAITGQPENQDVINGEEAVFDITATGMDLSYQWQISTDGGETWEDADCTTSDFTVTAQASMNGSQYRCVVTDVRGEELISGAAVLNVFAIIGEPDDASVADGGSAVFKVSAIGEGLAYQWQVSSDSGVTWENLENNTDSLTVAAEVSLSGSQYRCVVTDHLNRNLCSAAAGLSVSVVYNVTDSEQLESSHPYHNSCDASWIYQVENARSLSLTFDDQTKLEDGSDFLYIYDDKDQQIGKYTGAELAGQTIQISGDTVKLELVSDGSGNEWGFKVTDVTAEMPKDIESCEITLGTTSFIYDGTAKEPEVIVQDGSVTLVKGTDYTVSYENNIEPGTADITITGIGNYTGTVTEQFTIEKEVVVENPFVDVQSTSYYYNAVLWAYGNGITTGKDATHFLPNSTCTRAQVVAFLWRAKGEPEPETTVNPFVDVETSDYFYKAVLWAYENGITTGKDATHFQPDAEVERRQFVTFLWRAEGKPVPSIENPFTDVPAGQYYTDAVLWAYENGITTGKDATHFQPTVKCIRAQVVTFLYRAYY